MANEQERPGKFTIVFDGTLILIILGYDIYGLISSLLLIMHGISSGTMAFVLVHSGFAIFLTTILLVTMAQRFGFNAFKNFQQYRLRQSFLAFGILRGLWALDGLAEKLGELIHQGLHKENAFWMIEFPTFVYVAILYLNYKYWRFLRRMAKKIADELRESISK